MKQKVQNAILHPASMTVIGLLTGFLVKMLDIHCYAQHFGVSLSDIFSQAGVWIVIGIAISLYSRSNKLAMINIFLFSAGMLLTYYLTAEATNAVYGWTFIQAWAVFACLSPLMAYLARLTLRPGALALILKVGVFVGYAAMNWVLVGSFLHYYDLPFLAALVYLLFLKKWEAPGNALSPL
ncbi:MAG: hypothetical protein ACOYJZ_01990 [Acutalibacter sp.]|jgi:hypothetical protein